MPSDNPASSSTPAVAVGQGYNTFQDSGKNTLLDVKLIERSAETSFTVYTCMTKQDAYAALDVKANMSLKTAWGGFKTKLQVIDTVQKENMSITILVVANAITGVQTAAGPNKFLDPVPPNALELYRTGGDCFVSSITLGGTFMASWTFTSEDETSFKSLQGAVQGQFKGFATNFTAGFETSITAISQQSKTAIATDVKSVGYLGELPDASNQDMLNDFVRTWATKINDPNVIDFSTSSYLDIPNCPQGFDRVFQYSQQYLDANPDSEGVADLVFQVDTSITSIENVVTIYGYYGFQPNIDPKLSQVLVALQAAKADLARWLTQVIHNPTDSGVAPPVQIPDDDLATAIANYNLVNGQLVAGWGGISAWDVLYNDVELGKCVTQIDLGTIQDPSSKVYSLAYMFVTYTYRKDGHTQVRQHGHSDKCNIPSTSITIGDSGQITALSAGIAPTTSLIKGLSITVENQSAIVYPDMPVTDFTKWPWPPGNSALAGFRVDSDLTINSIAPIFVVFQPAKWKESGLAIRKRLERPVVKIT